MLLLHMHQYTGIVEGGGKLATRLGFPTANIPLADDFVSGIYAARARVLDKEYESVVYANQRRKLLEVHLLNFSGDLYGTKLNVVLLKKIREDTEFSDEHIARIAISDDVMRVRAYFKS